MGHNSLLSPSDASRVNLVVGRHVPWISSRSSGTGVWELDQIDVKRTRRPKATLRTVAEATGLAITTVSRALANDPRIAQATRQRVSEAALAQGYVPDRAAQRLRTGRTKVIQLLLNLDHEFLGFTQELIGGMSEVLAGTGYSVTIFPDALQSDRLAAIKQIVENRLGDAVIFNRTEPDDARVKYLTEQDFPFVCHGRTELGIAHPYVDFDNDAFAQMAMRRLASKGRKRILFILPPKRFCFSTHLRNGAMQAAEELGILCEIPDTITIDAPPAETVAWLRRRFDSADRPDGIICVGEVAAVSALAAITDSGMRYGTDIDVFAKRASEIFGLLRPHIDTVFEDLRNAGRAMGETVLKSMAGEVGSALQVLHRPLAEFT